jgi:hypothetical protein
MEREELQCLITTAVTDSMDTLLTAQLEPLQNQMAALSGTPPVLPMARDVELEAARQHYRDRLQKIDDEQAKIQNSTWTRPEVELVESSIAVNLPTNMTTTDMAPIRRVFDAKKLPRYAFSKDLAGWIKLMDIIVRIYGEQQVCHWVLMHCLVEGDVVRDWFVSLGNTDIEFITTRPGCWDFVKSKFMEKWRASAGQLQLTCDKRKKDDNESYTEYVLRKLSMMEDAYPEATEQNKILYIRLGLDSLAASYCREFRSLQAFLKEIRHYDMQLDLEKMYSGSTNNQEAGQQPRSYSSQYDTIY